MAKGKILIKIEGGVIQNIISTNPDLDICVVDYDAFQDGDESEIDSAVNVWPHEHFHGEWSKTITGVDLTDNEEMVKQRLTELDEEFPFVPYFDDPQWGGYSVKDIIKLADDTEQVDELTDEDALNILRWVRKTTYRAGVELHIMTNYILEWAKQNNKV